MLPKIKKKIKSFLMDETGSISKANIIRGALFLSAATITLKKIKAEVGGEAISDGGPVLDGTESNRCSNTVSQYTCTVESDGKWHEFKTCTTTNGQISPSCCGSHGDTPGHTNSATMKHWNADEEFHSNYIDFDYDGHEMDGYHSHHGYHADGNALCTEVDHTSHCSHSSHCSNWTCKW